MSRYNHNATGICCACLDSSAHELADIDAAAVLLRRLFPTGDSATVAELITQAANELQRTRRNCE